MLIDRKNINKIIPQREPFTMIDNLLMYNEKSVTTNFCLSADTLFIENSYYNECGITENMAQTAAAYLGYYSYIHKQDIHEGFIAQIKNLSITKYPTINDVITTTVIYSSVVMNIHIVKATVKIEEELIAKAELRIFVNE